MNSRDRKQLRREVFARNQPVVFEPIPTWEPININLDEVFLQPPVFIHDKAVQDGK
ncbi:MAG: hypothetical protein AB7F40_11450 [Victivallaceae bacterium]